MANDIAEQKAAEVLAIGRAGKELGATYVKCGDIELHIPQPPPALPEGKGISNDQAQFAASNMRPVSLRNLRDGTNDD